MLLLPVVLPRGSLFPFCLWLISGGIMAFAQESPAPEKPKTREIIFLPIGDIPPHREEVVNGVRRHLPPPPGSIPPRNFTIALGPEVTMETTLQLGQPGQALVVPNKPISLALRDANQGPEAPPWINLALPEDGDFLVLLTRGGTPPAWSTPRSLLLPHGPQDFPPGRVRLANLSGENVSILLGDEKVSLASGRSIARDPGVVERITLKAARLAADGKPAFFHQGELRQNPGERTLVLIYRADGMRPRQPIRLLVMKDKPSVAPEEPSPQEP